MKNVLLSAGLSLALSILILQSNSAMSEDCSKYYGKGYCVDYIQKKLGTKPKGDAKTWAGNIKTTEVKPGDVAIFDFGSWGHVAYVEKVIGSGASMKIEVSEMNWANPLDACARGPKFGEVSTRVINVNQVSRFWRK